MYQEYIEKTPKSKQVMQLGFTSKVTKDLLEAETAKVKAEVEAYQEKLFLSRNVNLEDLEVGNDETVAEDEEQERNLAMQKWVKMPLTSSMHADQSGSVINCLPQTLKISLCTIEEQTSWSCFIMAGGPCPKLGGKVQFVLWVISAIFMIIFSPCHY